MHNCKPDLKECMMLLVDFQYFSRLISSTKKKTLETGGQFITIQISRRHFPRISNVAVILLHSNGKYTYKKRKLQQLSKLQTCKLLQYATYRHTRMQRVCPPIGGSPQGRGPEKLKKY